MSELSTSDLLKEIVSTPTGSIAVFIQFLLGLALGYVVAKIFKYLLALLGILILGSLLSVWSLGSISKDTLSKIGVNIETIKSLATTLIVLLVGPVAVGFILGIVIGLVKK